jgi:uncharacterized protein
MKLQSLLLPTVSRRHGVCWRLVLLVAAAVLAASNPSAAQTDAPGEPVTIPGTEISGWGQVGEVLGRFGRPASAPPRVPAVLILHGSGGVDGRGAFYAKALQEAGIATLEIPMFARGGRPGPSVHATMPHAAAALRWLAAQPNVNARRLGVIGFSWGGQMSVVMSSDMVQDRLGSDVPKPAAFVSLYPVCTNMKRFLVYDQHALYNVHTRMGAAPLLILVGTRDDYEDNERACDGFVAMLPPPAQQRTTLRYFDGATHGFDQEKPLQFYDQNALARRGATINVIPSPKHAAEAREAVVSFFVKNLNP